MAPAARATTPVASRHKLEDAAFGAPDPLWAMAVEIAALRGCRPGAVPPGKLYWECALDETHVLRVNTRERTCSVWQLSGYRRWAQSAREPAPVWVMRAWLEVYDASRPSGAPLGEPDGQALGVDEVRHVLQTALETARLDVQTPDPEFAVSLPERAVDQALFVLEQIARRSGDQSSRALAKGAADDLRPVVAWMVSGVSS